MLIESDRGGFGCLDSPKQSGRTGRPQEKLAAADGSKSRAVSGQRETPDCPLPANAPTSIPSYVPGSEGGMKAVCGSQVCCWGGRRLMFGEFGGQKMSSSDVPLAGNKIAPKSSCFPVVVVEEPTESRPASDDALASVGVRRDGFDELDEFVAE
jgi:hypothetical protein